MAETELDLVGVKEAAIMLGVSKQRVSFLLREGCLPKPDARLAMGPVWCTETMREYAASRLRKSGRPKKFGARVFEV